MRLSFDDKTVILECLREIWDCADDEPYFEDQPKKEGIRRKLIQKFEIEILGSRYDN